MNKRERPIIISEQRREIDSNQKDNFDQKSSQKNFGDQNLKNSIDFDKASIASFSGATVVPNQSSNVVFRRKSFSAKKQKDKLDSLSSRSSTSGSMCGLDNSDTLSTSSGGGTNCVRSSSNLTVIERGRDITRTRKSSYESNGYKAPVVKSKSADNYKIISDISSKKSLKSGRSASLTRNAFTSDLGGSTVR